MITDNIKATMEFIKEKFQVDSSDTFTYRYEHTIRVGAIGQKIAREEKMNEEALIIACLLHDIGYIDCKTEEDYDLHGRISERIAREFLESIHYDKEWIETICYGIRIHTEEPDRKPTAFESSIADADNIDRFDAYRLYENLKYSEIEKMNAKKIKELAQKRIARLRELKDYPNGSKTANVMWKDRLSYQIAYYERLISQMELKID